jgi:hypothetical protein
MTIKDFKKNFLTQKNVVNHKKNYFGGHGTQTTYTTRTATFGGWMQVIVDTLGEKELNYTTDTHGDWSDEGTC